MYRSVKFPDVLKKTEHCKDSGASKPHDVSASTVLSHTEDVQSQCGVLPLCSGENSEHMVLQPYL